MQCGEFWCFDPVPRPKRDDRRRDHLRVLGHGDEPVGLLYGGLNNWSSLRDPIAYALVVQVIGFQSSARPAFTRYDYWRIRGEQLQGLLCSNHRICAIRPLSYFWSESKAFPVTEFYGTR